ncbi:hypothetical protein COCON_G00069180 [Conger conger]|uniref:Uncharacterized protein n=1 Tax=Conger conger TaxID=82655 RepID=A0A9Q1DT01_CONCO|nr:hypothetical protein COCON_G00069180 [Conger conger]
MKGGRSLLLDVGPLFGRMMLRLETVKRWLLELQSGQDWLQCVVGVDRCFVVAIKCALCSKHKAKLEGLRNFSPAFINGIEGNSLKKDNVKKHFQSEMHQKASALDKLASRDHDLPSAMAQTAEDSHLNRLFDLAYTVAKLGLPLVDFKTLARLELRHGVDLGPAAITEQKCRQYIDYIGRATKIELIQAIQEAPYFSVAVDGSADPTMPENGMIYVLYVDRTGLPCVRFFGFCDVERVHPECLRRTVLDLFLEEGVNLEGKLVGCMADRGTIRTNVAALLQGDMPYLVSLGCASHRLEMAVKKVFYGTAFDSVNEMFFVLAKLYWACPSQLEELRALARVMQEVDTKPQQANGTRWVQHRLRATRALLQTYPMVICNLANMSVQTTLPKEKAIFQDCLKSLRSVSFVLHLLFFNETLEPIAKLSSLLQNSNVDLLYTASLVVKFYSTLEQLSRGIPQGTLGEVFKDTVKDPQTVFFNGTRLHCGAEAARAFREKLPSYAAAISECVLPRFEAMHQMEPVRCLKILQAELWPDDPAELENYGNAELQAFSRHFAKLLALNQVDVTKLLEEWEQFKWYRAESLANMSSRQVWQHVLTRERAQFLNFRHVVQILHCFPVSSVVLERGQAAVSRMMAVAGGRMFPRTLEYLTRIALEGPELDFFDPQAAVSLYCFEHMGFFIESAGRRTSLSTFSGDESPSTFSGDESSPPRKKTCFSSVECAGD